MPKEQSTVELARAEKCPCGSGRTYGRCCKKRDFNWERRAEGEIVRSAPISDDLRTVLRAQDAEFIEIFGRKPRASDPVFFQKFYTSEQDLMRTTLKAMKAAGSPEPLVYAYKKTGRIVTAKNKNLLTPHELAEWNSAIDEYYERDGSGEEIDAFEYHDEINQFLLDATRRNQIVGGSFIDRHFNNYRRRNNAVSEIESAVAFATTNFVRCLKSIHILIDESVAFDAYHLVRAMYENYLTVKYLYENPGAKEAFSAQLGTVLGTHKLAESRSGVPRQSEIIEIKTGKRISIPSRWAMASSLGADDIELYNSLYRTLSSYAHSEITNVPYFLSDRGYDYQSQDFTFDVLVNCHLLCLLFFACLARHSPCLRYLRGDLSINAERSLFALAMVEETLRAAGRTLPEAYVRIIQHVTTSDPRLQRVAEAIQRAAAERHECK